MKKIIYIGKTPIGDGSITIQSMTNTKTVDVAQTNAQIAALEQAGADFIRLSLPDVESAKAVSRLKTGVPLIGDIHFSHIPALVGIDNGISKIRVNPSNLSRDGLREVVQKCAEFGIPMRVGVNKGSVKGASTPEQLVQLALDEAARIEDFGWNKLVLAVKTSDPKETVDAYRLLAKRTDYPLHIGLTEAGTVSNGMVKSAATLGSLLMDGIGDTIRVSLSGDPVREIFAAKQILRCIGLDKNFVNVIACPTCARTDIDVEQLALKVEDWTKNLHTPLKIAVMGCVVNGIGESADADFGIAGGKEKSVVFRNGQIVETVANALLEETLQRFIEEEIARNV